MLKACYACNGLHPTGQRCPTQPRWAGRKVSRLRRIVHNRDGGVCQECGIDVTFDECEVDHIVTRAMGGTDSLENLRCCCSACNQSKGNA